MKIETKFDYGQDVQLATDVENRKRRIVRILISDKGATDYILAFGLEQSQHTECEIIPYEEKKIGFG